MYNKLKNKSNFFIFVIAIFTCFLLINTYYRNNCDKNDTNSINQKISDNTNTTDTSDPICIHQNKTGTVSLSNKITQNVGSVKISTDKVINVPVKDTTQNKSSNDKNNVSNTNSNQPIRSISRGSKINNSYSNFFKNSVFLGDSLTKALESYNILNSYNVSAKIGLSIYKADPYVERTISLKPQTVFVMLGVNNIIDGSLTTKRFIDRYSEIISSLKKGLPNSKIYVLSVLPVNKNAQQEHPSLSDERINTFNNSIKAMCTKMNVTFIDVRPTLINNSKYYRDDGIHLKSDFYPIFLNYIKNQIS